MNNLSKTFSNTLAFNLSVRTSICVCIFFISTACFSCACFKNFSCILSFVCNTCALSSTAIFCCKSITEPLAIFSSPAIYKNNILKLMDLILIKIEREYVSYILIRLLQNCILLFQGFHLHLQISYFSLSIN